MSSIILDTSSKAIRSAVTLAFASQSLRNYHDKNVYKEKEEEEEEKMRWRKMGRTTRLYKLLYIRIRGCPLIMSSTFFSYFFLGGGSWLGGCVV